MDGLNQVVGALSTFSQIAISLTAIIGLLSILFKPIRKFVSWIYKKLVGNKSNNEDIIRKITEVETTLSSKVDTFREELTRKIEIVSRRNDENEKDRIRWEILDFANSCRNGRKHTKDEYEHIFRMNDKYEKLLAPEEKNSYFAAEYDYIIRLYAERQEKNDFL